MNELILNNKVILAGGVKVSDGEQLNLPISSSDPVSPTVGDLYYNSTDNAIRIYRGSGWAEVTVSGGASSNFVNKITLNSTDITNKYVTLTGTPATLSDTILNIVGGITQDYGVDFTVSGNQLSWSGLGLDGILASGDKLIIQFS